MTESLQADFRIIQVSWATHSTQLKAVREPVFVVEQAVEPDFEWDEIDAVAIHLLALSNNLAIGCARIISHRKIGRMAVLKELRGRGIGQALLQEAINVCQAHGTKTINLTAQTHAITFYKQAGFVEISGVYQDANIPHVDMQLDL